MEKCTDGERLAMYKLYTTQVSKTNFVYPLEFNDYFSFYLFFCKFK